MESLSEPPPRSSEAPADPELPSRPVTLMIARPKRRLPPPRKNRSEAGVVAGGGEERSRSTVCFVLCSCVERCGRCS